MCQHTSDSPAYTQWPMLISRQQKLSQLQEFNDDLETTTALINERENAIMKLEVCKIFVWSKLNGYYTSGTNSCQTVISPYKVMNWWFIPLYGIITRSLGSKFSRARYMGGGNMRDFGNKLKNPQSQKYNPLPNTFNNWHARRCDSKHTGYWLLIGF